MTKCVFPRNCTNGWRNHHPSRTLFHTQLVCPSQLVHTTSNSQYSLLCLGTNYRPSCALFPSCVPCSPRVTSLRPLLARPIFFCQRSFRQGHHGTATTMSPVRQELQLHSSLTQRVGRGWRPPKLRRLMIASAAAVAAAAVPQELGLPLLLSMPMTLVAATRLRHHYLPVITMITTQKDNRLSPRGRRRTRCRGASLLLVRAKMVMDMAMVVFMLHKHGLTGRHRLRSSW